MVKALVCHRGDLGSTPAGTFFSQMDSVLLQQDFRTCWSIIETPQFVRCVNMPHLDASTWPSNLFNAASRCASVCGGYIEVLLKQTLVSSRVGLPLHTYLWGSCKWTGCGVYLCIGPWSVCSTRCRPHASPAAEPRLRRRAHSSRRLAGRGRRNPLWLTWEDLKHGGRILMIST